MRQLRLVGLNEDGTRLVLRDEAAAADYLLPNDERLAAALRGDRARLGQLEIALESQLRPREMQARVRAGESPEQVAVAAALPLDKVMRMVAPVVAEREYVVERARISAIRRGGTDGPGAVLEPTVTERLNARGVTPDSVRWDSRRRDDGAWVVEVTYQLDGREHVAEWTYDATARATTPVDDEARALSGIKPTPGPVDLFGGGDQRDPASGEPTPTAQLRLTPLRGGQVVLDSIDASADDDPAEDIDTDLADLADLAEPAMAAAGRRAARRASVPSWDEIMFGRRRSRD